MSWYQGSELLLFRSKLRIQIEEYANRFVMESRREKIERDNLAVWYKRIVRITYHLVE